MITLLTRLFIKNKDNTGDFKVRNSYGKLCSLVCLFLNVVLFVFKLLAGVFSGSVGILADAFNNLSDASSSIITLIGFRLSEKPADSDHPFGHGRYEYIAGLAVAVIICSIGIELLTTSFNKILHPNDVSYSVLTWIVLGTSIAVKVYMMFFNHKIGKRIDSNALLATSSDSRNDALSTTAVLISSIVCAIFGFRIEGYIGACVAIFVIISGLGLIKDTLNPILGTAPSKETVDAIHNKVLSYDHILGTHDLMVHDYGPGNKFASVHVEMDAKFDTIASHDIIDNIENDVFETMGIHLVIHYDPISVDDSEVSVIRTMLYEVVKEIDKRLTIHDVRIVKGITHTNVVFDCVVPAGFSLKPNTTKELIQNKVKALHPDYICVIKIDQSYLSVN